MEEYINNPYAKAALAIIASSLALAVLNLFPRVGQSEKWYHKNSFLILIISTVFTVLVTDFSELSVDWQWCVFKMLLVIMTCVLIAITKGQEIVDAWINKITKKITENVNKDVPPKP